MGRQSTTENQSPLEADVNMKIVFVCPVREGIKRPSSKRCWIADTVTTVFIYRFLEPEAEQGMV